MTTHYWQKKEQEIVCGPWLFDATGPLPQTPATAASVKLGLLFCFQSDNPCWCFSKMRPGFWEVRMPEVKFKVNWVSATQDTQRSVVHTWR